MADVPVSAARPPRRRPSARLPGPIDAGLVTVGRLTSLSIASTRYIVGDLVRGRFPWREFILQAWFVTSVSLLPAVLVAIPFGVIVAINFRRLVAPRVAALVVVGVLLCAVVAMTGVLAGYLFNVYVQHGTPGAYLNSFTDFATAGDFVVAEIKAAVFGFLAAIVAAHEGLNARGGPKGVADAVNQCVVLSFLLLFSTNILITQAYLMISPPVVVRVAALSPVARRAGNNLAQLGEQATSASRASPDWTHRAGALRGLRLRRTTPPDREATEARHQQQRRTAQARRAEDAHGAGETGGALDDQQVGSCLEQRMWRSVRLPLHLPAQGLLLARRGSGRRKPWRKRFSRWRPRAPRRPSRSRKPR